jgi:tetratricopeptide (TPR) repeat protein
MWQMGKPTAAEAECRTELAMLQKLADDNPAVTLFRDRLAYALNNLGDVFRSHGRAAEAKERYERAIALREPQFQADPTNTEHRYTLVCGMRRRGMTLRDLGDAAGAAADVRRALALCDGLPPRSASELFEIEMACCHAALVGLAGLAGSGVSAAEAQDEAARAMEWLRRAVAMGYRNVSELRIESALDVLRSREDFQFLMMDLAFPAEPFAPGG